jgi:hypothetical protein
VADVAEKRRCELIVVGSDSRNALVRLISRSIIPGLISSAKVPVLVCQTKEPSGKTAHRTRIAQPSRRKLAARQQVEQPVHARNE